MNQLIRILTSPFDLSQDYPLRVVWLAGTGVAISLRAFSFCSSTISQSMAGQWMILFREWTASGQRQWPSPSGNGNTRIECNQEHSLSPLTIDYLDVTLWQREQWRDEQLLQTQTAWWQHQLADLEPLNLPLDYPRPPSV